MKRSAAVIKTAQMVKDKFPNSGVNLSEIERFVQMEIEDQVAHNKFMGRCPCRVEAVAHALDNIRRWVYDDRVKAVTACDLATIRMPFIFFHVIADRK